MNLANICTLTWMLILAMIERTLCQWHLYMWMKQVRMLHHVGTVSVLLAIRFDACYFYVITVVVVVTH